MSPLSKDSNLALCVPRSSKYGPNPDILSWLVSFEIPQSSSLPPNHVLVRVDRFGFSANNITYHALGEVPHFRYFEFHAAPKVGEVSPNTHGVTPMWGFGNVVASSHPKIRTGERVYGYFAPTRYLLLPVSEQDVNDYSFYVPRPHLPADRRPYNQIRRCASDAEYDSSPVAEDLTMLYRPLYWTSFWCEDWIYSSSYRDGADLIVISSASSKTAFTLAYCIQKRITRKEIPDRVKIIGLTSKGNLSFAKGLGLYHEVVSYDELQNSTFPAGRTGIYVDVAGNERLNQAIITDHGSTFVAGIRLGMSNLSPGSQLGDEWSTNTFAPKTSTGVLTFEEFFMPEWLAIRRQQLSIAGITTMQQAAWRELMRDCRGWVEIERIYGGEAVQKAYNAAVQKGLGPEKGYTWSLWEPEGRDDESLQSKL